MFGKTEEKQSIDETRSLPASPQEKKGRGTAAFQGGAFSSLPPGSNGLFSSLNVLSLRFDGVAAVEEVPETIAVLVLFSLARVSTLSIGDEIFPSLLESTPAVKMPSAIIRPVSHTPSFGGLCCPGVLRPVLADDDVSSCNSWLIVPSFFKLKCTPDGLSGLGEHGLQCCTV